MRRAVIIWRCTLAASPIVAFAPSCLDATQVDLVITTDIGCPDDPDPDDPDRTLDGVSITKGPDANLEGLRPVATTRQCERVTSGDNRVGKLVFVPSAGDGDAFNVLVVAGVTTPVDECKDADYEGCIVARRSLRFLPHAHLTIPVALRNDCVGVPCAEGQTCVQGECKSSQVDPEQCEGAGCDETVLPPPNGTGTPTGTGTGTGTGTSTGTTTGTGTGTTTGTGTGTTTGTSTGTTTGTSTGTTTGTGTGTGVGTGAGSGGSGGSGGAAGWGGSGGSGGSGGAAGWGGSGGAAGWGGSGGAGLTGAGGAGAGGGGLTGAGGAGLTGAGGAGAGG